MLTITELGKKMAITKATRILEEMDSDRKIEKKMAELERSTNERERLQAIAIRSILNGGTEESGII